MWKLWSPFLVCRKSKSPPFICLPIVLCILGGWTQKKAHCRHDLLSRHLFLVSTIRRIAIWITRKHANHFHSLALASSLLCIEKFRCIQFMGCFEGRKQNHCEWIVGLVFCCCCSLWLVCGNNNLQANWIRKQLNLNCLFFYQLEQLGHNSCENYA